MKSNPKVQRFQSKSSDLIAKTAGLFENLFFCCSSPNMFDDEDDRDRIPYVLPELPEDKETNCSLKTSGSASTSDKAIASADSFVSRKSGGAGGIVFLDAMEPHLRPVLHLPASASIRTATTASMSGSSHNTIPTIQGSHTFDSECSMFSGSTEYTRARSISSMTSAKCRTYSSQRDTRHPEDDSESIRQVQHEVLRYLPKLSATDGYRC